VFPVDFEGGEHVYRVHPINVQLMTDPVIMPAKKNLDVILVQKILTNTNHVTSCIVMLKDVTKVSLLQTGQNDMTKNIVSVFYDIQCSLNNFELRASIMTNSSPDHNTSTSKMIGLVHAMVRKMFPTPAVHTITSIDKAKCKSRFVTIKDVLPGVKPPTTACTSPG
jgi:hypothetical protein